MKYQDRKKGLINLAKIIQKIYSERVEYSTSPPSSYVLKNTNFFFSFWEGDYPAAVARNWATTLA